MDALIDGARQSIAVGDTATYSKDVEGFISQAYTEVPRIPLCQPNLSVATQQNISGYTYWFHRQLDYRSIRKA
jgi:peptide/nickel transport system substrate-binding protein